MEKEKVMTIPFPKKEETDRRLEAYAVLLEEKTKKEKEES